MSKSNNNELKYMRNKATIFNSEWRREKGKKKKEGQNGEKFYQKNNNKYQQQKKFVNDLTWQN